MRNLKPPRAMTTETLILLIGALANLIVTLGGGSIFYIQITKKLKAAEVKGKEAEVKDKNVDIELKQADAWKELFDKSQERCQEKSSTIRNLYERLNEKERINNEKDAEIMRLKFEKETCDKEHCFKEKILGWNQCTRDECVTRTPPRKYGTQVEAITE